MQLREAYFSIRRSAQARLTATGATVDQVVVLTLIAEEQGLTQRDIVERSCSDPSTIRAMLVLLEKRGWIRRDFDPNDARVWRVSLSAEGRKQQRRLKRIAHIGDPTRMENLLADDELQIVRNCLQRIAGKQAEVATSATGKSKQDARRRLKASKQPR
jgi:DNA-binding MarR family transcriptional regulator